MTTRKTYRRFSRAGEVAETKGPAMIAYAVEDGRGEERKASGHGSAPPGRAKAEKA